MAKFHEPSFITHPNNDSYIWRTWFLEECEEKSLFGLNFPNYLRIVEDGYRVGTRLYLEDAPLYWKTQSKHRICGPYVIAAAVLPHSECRVKHKEPATGSIVVYYDPAPEKGPWLDQRRVERQIEGVRITFEKLASEFSYFPYRFRIEKAGEYTIEIHPHSDRCGWCPFYT